MKSTLIEQGRTLASSKKDEKKSENPPPPFNFPSHVELKKGTNGADNYFIFRFGSGEEAREAVKLIHAKAQPHIVKSGTNSHRQTSGSHVVWHGTTNSEISIRNHEPAYLLSLFSYFDYEPGFAARALALATEMREKGVVNHEEFENIRNSRPTFNPKAPLLTSSQQTGVRGQSLVQSNPVTPTEPSSSGIIEKPPSSSSSSSSTAYTGTYALLPTKKDEKSKTEAYNFPRELDCNEGGQTHTFTFGLAQDAKAAYDFLGAKFDEQYQRIHGSFPADRARYPFRANVKLSGSPAYKITITLQDDSPYDHVAHLLSPFDYRNDFGELAQGLSTRLQERQKKDDTSEQIKRQFCEIRDSRPIFNIHAPPLATPTLNSPSTMSSSSSSSSSSISATETKHRPRSSTVKDWLTSAWLLPSSSPASAEDLETKRWRELKVEGSSETENVKFPQDAVLAPDGSVTLTFSSVKEAKDAYYFWVSQTMRYFGNDPDKTNDINLRSRIEKSFDGVKVKEDGKIEIGALSCHRLKHFFGSFRYPNSSLDLVAQFTASRAYRSKPTGIIGMAKSKLPTGLVKSSPEKFSDAFKTSIAAGQPIPDPKKTWPDKEVHYRDIEKTIAEYKEKPTSGTSLTRTSSSET